jgi:hypothetical protein
MGRLGSKPIFPVKVKESERQYVYEQFRTEERGLGISSEPGSMVLDNGRPVFVAAVGEPSVAVCGTGAPGCEGGGSAGTQSFSQLANTHRQQTRRPFLRTHPLRVGSGQVWVRSTLVARVGLVPTTWRTAASWRWGAMGFACSCKYGQSVSDPSKNDGDCRTPLPLDYHPRSSSSGVVRGVRRRCASASRWWRWRWCSKKKKKEGEDQHTLIDHILEPWL